eukprot:TRINITY_DN456_c0_g1_i1.p2 TRINITY_DN456_c0_g1~~TRINITY_DN456_c0_g1_i1.p2  ORF type:complete len:348 (-),score=86.90 TRINITY_DN456_c0_g1_i1:51-1058(-)
MARCCWCAVAAAVAAAAVLAFYVVATAVAVPPQPPQGVLRAANVSFVVLDDGRYLEYHTAGDPDGVPVLLFQGTLQTGRTVCALTSELLRAHGMRGVCPTLPGYGFSSWSEAPWSAYHHDIEQLADHLHIEKFAAVAGWSGGGLPAVVTASTMPDRVGRLLLVVAAPPDPSWYDYGTLGHGYLWLASHTPINDVLVHHLVVPLLRRNCPAFLAKSGPPAEAARLAALVPGGIDTICADMVRSVTDCGDRAYAAIGRRWFVSTPVDWAAVARRRVDVVYAADDALITPRAGLMYHEHVPASNLYVYDGGHGVAGVDVGAYLSLLWGEEPTGVRKLA